MYVIFIFVIFMNSWRNSSRERGGWCQ